MFSTVIKHMFWMHYVKQLEAHACFSIDRKMPILILFSQPCQSSPLARSSSCSCIRPQSIWSLPIKFPFVYAGYKTGTSFSLPCTFPLRTFLPITLLYTDPNPCNSSTPTLSSASPAVCTDSSCPRKVRAYKSRAALPPGTGRSIPTKTWPRITLVKSCLSYFPLALSRDGSRAYVSAHPPCHGRTWSVCQNQKHPLPAQQGSGGRALPAERH